MIPVAVSNTGPLLAFANAGLLRLLSSQFARIIVPEAVVREINAGTASTIRFDAMRLELPQLKIAADGDANPLLESMLDPGEAAVIQLSISLRPDITLIDERKGRKIAADIYRLPIIGTVGILLKAKKNRSI